MILNMSNKFNNFPCTSARTVIGMNTNTNAGIAAVAASSSTSPSSGAYTLTAPSNFSNDSNSSAASTSGKAERESIHSGQFMVSTFEAEEAQDDLDDSEIKMLDPEDPSLSKSDDGPNTCMEVQLYVPRKVAQHNRYGNSESHGLITSHLEIETSLTKLFKCMNLAYSQKLTSPKWNHFKGVRLRWKDKIRLNNVIWRCWHMQFILKRRTPVCQFASPLDVDVHSNPQSVVLEGKYWKRQLAVIKAEYRKWRRNYKSKISGCLIYDTKSEFDFLEWSPLNDRNLMLSDDWTSDTLFSAINGPFPFPDSREIARGAGIADFIQPSLGPLQPNLDDIDFTFAELLQNSRLAPVPEEGADEMIKNVDYGFSSIMGAEQIDSSNMMDVSASSVVPSMPNTNNDSNMLELNTPLTNLQFCDIEQQFANRSVSAQILSSVTRANAATNQVQSLTSDDAIMTEPENLTNSILMQQVGRHSLKNFANSLSGSTSGTAGADSSSSGNIGSAGNSMLRQSNNDFPVKKGRISKSSQRPFRREPHNYDKAQPTLHQTTIYQQMLAEQQKNQQLQQHTQHLQQPNLSGSSLQHHTSVYQPTQQQQQRSLNNTFTPSSQQYNTNLLSNPVAYGSSTERITNLVSGQLTGQVQGQTINSNNSAGAYGLLSPSQATTQLNASNRQGNNTLQNIKIEVPSPDVLTMFNLSQVTAEGYSPYKPYNHAGNFKKSSSTGTYINIRGNSSNNQLYMQQQHDQLASSAGGGGTIHAQSLPLTLGMHLPGLTNVLQTLPPQLSPPNMQHTSQKRLIGQQLNLAPQPAQQASTHHQHQQHQQQQQQQQQLQHHQQTSNQTQHLQSMLNSQQHHQQQQQQQQHLLPQPQHQISQPTISTNNLPKEIFRSNSLPLNVSLQKIDTRLTQNDNNFAVPNKYHVGKSTKTRSRSNSMHQHMIHSSTSSSSSPSSSSAKAMHASSGTAGVGSGSSVISGASSLHINSQLQAATSDPMLNSTLAQLLTTNKQQSVSTSNIATPPNPALSPMTALHMQATQLNVQNKISCINMYATASQNQQQQYHQQQQQQQNQSLSSPPSPTLINATSPISMQQQQHQKQFDQSQQQQSQHQHQQQHQQKHLQTQHIHLQQQHPHKSPKKSTSLPAPVAPSMLSSPPASKMLSYPLTVSSQSGCSTHLSLSPESFHDQDSPLSPTHSLKYPRDSQRRAGHIHAEQKRRYNIKNGFDQLHDLIPQLQQSNAKLSKAAMLQKGAEHIKHLRNERNALKDRMDAMRMERDALNNSLTHLHSILPANGAPVTRQGTEHVRQLYEQYVRRRTQENFKFWILGLILEPLLTSYTSTVSSASLDELRRTAFLWVDQHCSLIDLRPAVSNKLKYLSMKTDILSDPPSTLQEEVAKAVNNTSGQHPNLHGT